MKATILVFSFLCTYLTLKSQSTFEIEGKAKIGEVDIDNSFDSLIVWTTDGTLGIRETSSLLQFQILSISNDTIVL